MSFGKSDTISAELRDFQVSQRDLTAPYLVWSEALRPHCLIRCPRLVHLARLPVHMDHRIPQLRAVWDLQSPDRLIELLRLVQLPRAHQRAQDNHGRDVVRRGAPLVHAHKDLERFREVPPARVDAHHGVVGAGLLNLGRFQILRKHALRRLEISSAPEPTAGLTLKGLTFIHQGNGRRQTGFGWSSPPHGRSLRAVNTASLIKEAP